MKRFALAALLVALAAVLGVVTTDGQSASSKGTVAVQILGFNDLHGNLEPPSGSSGRIGTVEAGGVEYLATHLAQLRATNPNTVVVSAGDLFGASPLLSALFREEPSVEAMNIAGLDIATVGNHEFDKGVPEVLRLQKGGCAKEGCPDNTPYDGAKFKYLSGNVFLQPTAAEKAAAQKAKKIARAKPLFEPYTIRTLGGVKVGFIGIVLQGAPTIITPSAVAGLTFYPEAYMTNYWAQNLRKAGAKAIVVLIHEGGFQTGTFNACQGITEPIVSIVNQMSNDIDVVVSAHTHQSYNCTIGTKLVTSAASFGRVISDIDLEIDSDSGEVVSKTATNRIVTRDVAKNAAETALLDKYRGLSAARASKVIGRVGADITRTANAAGESALGDVIADAQLAVTKPADKGNAVIAFMNPGGIRNDLNAAQISGGEQPGQVTYGEAFSVQPFGNTLVVKTLTGAQIKALLEQQFDNPVKGQSRVLQVSNGFTYSYNGAAPAGSRVDAASIKLNGTTIAAGTSYRVTMNSFLATGGDGFTVFNQGTSQLGGEVDLDALVAYFAANATVAPGPQNRITKTG